MLASLIAKRTVNIAVILFGFLVCNGRSVADTPQTNLSDDLVSVTVGDRLYEIPREYIFAIRKDEKDRVERVMMRAWWPGLAPISQAEAEAWRVSDSKTYIVFHIEAKARDYGPYFRNNTERDDAGWGLIHMSLGRSSVFTPKNADYMTPLGGRIAFYCFDFSEEILKRVNGQMRCQAGYPTSLSGVGIYYDFVRSHLSEWQKVDSRIRELVLSFGR